MIVTIAIPEDVNELSVDDVLNLLGVPTEERNIGVRISVGRTMKLIGWPIISRKNEPYRYGRPGHKPAKGSSGLPQQ